MVDSADVVDRTDKHQFELVVDGHVALSAYTRDGDTLIFTHTEVPAALEGRGVGSALVKGALAQVRAAGLKIVPACSFVAAYLKRHPEEQDLLGG